VKRAIIGAVAGLIAGGLATWMVLKHSEGGEENAKKEEHKEESRVQHGTNGESFLKLDAEAQRHIGLKIEPIAAAQLPPEVKGYGRVLDPAPLAALHIEGESARAALAASTREFERLKRLHEQDQNVSTRALETAEAAAKHDQILAESVKNRFDLNWGRALGGQKDLPAFINSLAAQEAALVRIDLPLGEALQTPPVGARIAALTAGAPPVEAQFLGPATTADPLTQGQGFLFLLTGNPLPPGAAVTGWLKVPGEPASGVIVPRAALLRHEGGAYVYVQIGDENFQRREIELDRPVEKGWFVMEGVKAGEKIVVIGAQQLLSEELKSKGGEE